MPKRSPNPRLVKTHRNYTVGEIAALCKVHKNTVLAWRDAGLVPIDDRRKPLLFLGTTLSAFLTTRRARRRCPLRPGQFYCLACREAKEAALGMVEYVPLTATSGNARGLCPTCGKLVHRRIALDGFAANFGAIDVPVTDAAPRIEDAIDTSVSSDFEQTGTK
jgi:hypothetical protein